MMHNPIEFLEDRLMVPVAVNALQDRRWLGGFYQVIADFVATLEADGWTITPPRSAAIPDIDTIPVLRWFADHDWYDDLFWNTKDTDSVRFFVRCSDVFEWATSDLEEITAADLPGLQQALDDLKDDLYRDVYAAKLWVARKRQMRPQEAWFRQTGISDRVKDLFCAAGPERDPGR